MIIETYVDLAGKFRWRMKADNGKILAVSSEGYETRRAMLDGLEIVREDARDAKHKSLEGAE